MPRHVIALQLAAMLALSGCGAKTLATEQLVFSDAQASITSASNAIADYGIAKGIAGVAETGLTLAGQPAATAGIAALVAVADATVAKLQTSVNAVQIDLTAVQSLVAQLNAQVQAVRLQAATFIKAVPSVAPTAPAPAATPAVGTLVN